MANKEMKRDSISVIIREMQIKTTVKYHLTQVRSVIIIKSTNTVERVWRKGTLLHCWWECRLISHYGEQHGNFSKNKQKNQLPYDPTISILGVHSEKTIIQKGTCGNVHCSTIHDIVLCCVSCSIVSDSLRH